MGVREQGENAYSPLQPYDASVQNNVHLGPAAVRSAAATPAPHTSPEKAQCTGCTRSTSKRRRRDPAGIVHEMAACERVVNTDSSLQPHAASFQNHACTDPADVRSATATPTPAPQGSLPINADSPLQPYAVSVHNHARTDLADVRSTPAASTPAPHASPEEAPCIGDTLLRRSTDPEDQLLCDLPCHRAPVPASACQPSSAPHENSPDASEVAPAVAAVDPVASPQQAAAHPARPACNLHDTPIELAPVVASPASTPVGGPILNQAGGQGFIALSSPVSAETFPHATTGAPQATSAHSHVCAEPADVRSAKSASTPARSASKRRRRDPADQVVPECRQMGVREQGENADSPLQPYAVSVHNHARTDLDDVRSTTAASTPAPHASPEEAPCIGDTLLRRSSDPEDPLLCDLPSEAPWPRASLVSSGASQRMPAVKRATRKFIGCVRGRAGRGGGRSSCVPGSRQRHHPARPACNLRSRRVRASGEASPRLSLLAFFSRVSPVSAAPCRLPEASFFAAAPVVPPSRLTLDEVACTDIPVLRKIPRRSVYTVAQTLLSTMRGATASSVPGFVRLAAFGKCVLGRTEGNPASAIRKRCALWLRGEVDQLWAARPSFPSSPPSEGFPLLDADLLPPGFMPDTEVDADSIPPAALRRATRLAREGGVLTGAPGP